MKPISYLLNLSCSSCGKIFDPTQIQTYCIDCNAPLISNYDLTSIKKIVDREEFSSRHKNMWRWFDLLPINDQSNIVSLGEGDTPLLRLNHLGQELGFPNLFLKDEGINPTGSFKARGISCAVSKALELGIRKIVIPSAGNAGGALSAYAARGELDAYIYMPNSSPASNIMESKITGAKVELVDGLINIAGKYAEQKALEAGWFNLSTFKEPYRVEGKKIMGYEIAESFDWKLPNVIIYPTGGGTGLVGMWKAFCELRSLGWLESKTMPRMIAVQSDGCAPIVKSMITNKQSCDLWENPHTIATGLCVPKSFADKLILSNIRESNGTAVEVSDDEIVQSQSNLAKREGIFSCPEGAATLAGLMKLIYHGLVLPEESIVLFNTGTGLKYNLPSGEIS